MTMSLGSRRRDFIPLIEFRKRLQPILKVGFENNCPLTKLPRLEPFAFHLCISTISVAADYRAKIGDGVYFFDWECFWIHSGHRRFLLNISPRRQRREPETQRMHSDRILQTPKNRKNAVKRLILMGYFTDPVVITVTKIGFQVFANLCRISPI